MEWPPPLTEQTTPQPAHAEPERTGKKKRAAGWCCMCGPSALLLLFMACWPVGAYVIGRSGEAGLVPDSVMTVFIVSMIAIWPILAVGSLVGIPIGIILLNKK